MVQGLGFLSKKSWHTKNIANQEKVWMAEQRKVAEEKKMKELAKQIQQEKEQDEFDRIAGKSGSRVVRDRGIDWMYQEGTRGELAQQDEDKRREEFLLGKEFVGEGAVQGDFDGGGAKEGINNVMSGVEAVPSAAGEREGEDDKKKKASEQKSTITERFDNMEPSVKERNENFRIRVEDPMFHVIQAQQQAEARAEKNKMLYNRVMGYSDDDSASGSDDNDDDVKRRKKHKKKHKKKKKDKKHRKHKEKSKSKSRSRDTIDKSRSKRSRHDSDDESGDDDCSNARSVASSVGNDRKRRRRSPTRGRNRNGGRSRSRSRSRSPGMGEKSMDRSRSNSKRYHPRERYARRSRSRSRSRSNDRSKDAKHRRHDDVDRQRSAQGHHRRSHHDRHEIDRRPNHDWHSRHQRSREHAHRANADNRRWDGNRRHDGRDSLHGRSHRPGGFHERHAHGNHNRDAARPDRNISSEQPTGDKKYGLKGVKGNGKLDLANIGPDRNLLEKRRQERESECDRKRSLTSSRRRSGTVDRQKALEEMQRDATMQRRDVARRPSDKSEEDAPPRSKDASFLKDMSREAHGINDNVTLQSRVAQNRNKAQRLHDKFL